MLYTWEQGGGWHDSSNLSLALPLPRPSPPSFAKFCSFYLLSTSCFHPLISIPTSSSLANFLISYCPGYCKIPVSGNGHFIHHFFWFTVFQKYNFSQFLSYQQFRSSSVFYPKSLKTTNLWTKQSFHSLLNHEEFLKRLIPRVSFFFLFLAVYTCSFFLLLLGSTLGAYLLQPTTKNLCPLKVTFLWSGNLGITNCGSDLTSLQPIPLSLSILTRPRGMEMGTCYNLSGTTLLERIKKPSSRVIPAVFRS